ncbi:ubiquinone biosynthesis methyltransferase UbiE [Paracoccus sp. Z330]|uniref:Ubiquinone biosynthesis methyltransferase UbiE n=1 Tax=Paracoccus onchidii TaxID=3017813 RepID=A0ABT4ZCT8_9RHOB|nr:DUF6552 family protein [Paracoccus onchidii]MDB6177171.1 ubiquinone biosynthesis methyltransferase UbiE [Paracoccus onchidii]
MQSDLSAAPRTETFVLVVKWAASLVQIAGYAATAFGETPWNLYFFVLGVIGWFVVGVMWKDRAIMLIHLVALAAMIAGMSNG